MEIFGWYEYVEPDALQRLLEGGRVAIICGGYECGNNVSSSVVLPIV